MYLVISKSGKKTQYVLRWSRSIVSFSKSGKTNSLCLTLMDARVEARKIRKVCKSRKTNSLCITLMDARVEARKISKVCKSRKTNSVCITLPHYLLRWWITETKKLPALEFYVLEQRALKLATFLLCLQTRCLPVRVAGSLCDYHYVSVSFIIVSGLGSSSCWSTRFIMWTLCVPG